MSLVLGRLVKILEEQGHQQEWQTLVLELLAGSVDRLVSLQSRMMEDARRQAAEWGFGLGSGSVDVEVSGDDDKEKEKDKEDETRDETMKE